MSAFDASPRSSKRQRISGSTYSSLPLPPRTPRPRKADLPGKPQSPPSESPVTKVFRSKADADSHDAPSDRHTRLQENLRGTAPKVDQIPESAPSPIPAPTSTPVSGRKRGRPRKVDQVPECAPSSTPTPEPAQVSVRKRGRPRKVDQVPRSSPTPVPSPTPAPVSVPASGRQRGRPRKVDQVPETAPSPTPAPTSTPVSGRKRGRPRKVDQVPRSSPTPAPVSVPASGRKRGRPRKIDRVPIPAPSSTPVPSPTPAPVSAQVSGRKRGRPRKVDQVPSSSPTSAPSPTPPPISTHVPDRKGGRPQHSVQSADKPQDKPQDDFTFEKIPTEDVQVDHEAWAANSSEDGQNFLENAASELQLLIKEDTIDSLMMLKTQVMEGLTGQRRLPLVGLDQEYQKVYQIIEQTVLAGEGNSALIIGSRGTAKTTLVESVIADLAPDHRDVFHVVRLNGFIHTDDKLALQEIWRQLGREMKVEDDSMGGKSNYADTLTSLLALLAHPTEYADVSSDQTAKSIVFILDEFDLFASHPRQTLLYNLFDVAQSRNAPIIVLGLTTKVDVVASLEKRVKSRFGQRYVHLSLSRTLSSFKSICKSALIPPTTISSRLNPINPKFQGLLTAWTSYIEALFEHDPVINNFLRTLYSHSKSVPAFLASALLPVSYLSPTTLPTGSSFISPALLPPDSKLHLLPSLSDSELALLIAAARLDIILDSDTCTFGMAYDEYVQLASKVKIASSAAGQAAVGGGARVWGREVAKEAWERLVDLELVLSISGGRGGGIWRVDVALEEIAPSVPGLGSVMAKWCREI
ncbi:hypothetical protein MMC22_006484 [Lobaria immixta]|nr:hypothetical protein [Lobaria immixta]